MMTWTPAQWGEAAGTVAGAYFTALFIYQCICGLFGGFMPKTYEVELTLNHKLEVSDDR